MSAGQDFLAFFLATRKTALKPRVYPFTLGPDAGTSSEVIPPASYVTILALQFRIMLSRSAAANQAE